MESQLVLRKPTLQLQQINEPNDYLGKESWFITRLLSLDYFRVLTKYSRQINNSNIIGLRPQLKQMVKNEYLWKQLCGKKQKFRLWKQLFYVERFPLLIIMLMALIVATSALFAAFYQKYLFLRLKDEQNIDLTSAEAQKQIVIYQISGFVFLGIIIGASLLKFIIFNQIQGLANEVSRNIRIHLQNCFMRALLKFPKKMESGFLFNSFFVYINLIADTIKSLPYFLVSLAIVFGITGFIISQVGSYGWILFGITLVVFGIQIALLLLMLNLHHKYAHISDRRTTLSRLSGWYISRLLLNRLIIPFLDRVQKLRQQETNINFRYNLIDGIIQFLTQFNSLFFIFILYVLEERHKNIDYVQILQVSIFFSILKSPFKMVAYGLSNIVQGYAVIQRFQQLFQSIQKQQLNQPQAATFPRLYTYPSILQTTLEVKLPSVLQSKSQKIFETKIQISQMNIMIKQSKLTMIVERINTKPNSQEYLKAIEQQIIKTNKTFSIVSHHTFIMNQTIKNNIIFHKPYQQQRYNKVLKIVKLNKYIDSFIDKDNTQVSSNSIEFFYGQLCLRIELARAIYLNVEYLLIYRILFDQFQEILSNIKQQRNKQGKTTILINPLGLYYNIADQIVLLKDNKIVKGSYFELRILLQSIENKYYNNLHHLTRINDIDNVQKIKQEPYNPQKIYSLWFLFKFYNLNHRGAWLITIIVILIPPLLQLYYEIIIAQSAEQYSLKQLEHSSLQKTNTLRSGATVALWSIVTLLRALILAIYIRGAGFILYKQIIQKILKMNIDKAFSRFVYNRTTEIQRDIDNVDTKVTSEIDLGVSIVFQQISIIVFGTVVSRYYLLIGLPFIFLNLIMFYLMAQYNRKLYIYRLPFIDKMKTMMQNIIRNRKQYKGYNVQNKLFENFTNLNKSLIILQSNQDWILESLGIIMQLINIIFLLIFIILSITQFHSIANNSFLELGVSFLLGLTNTSRIQLIILRNLDMHLIGMSNIYYMFNREQQKSVELKIQRIYSIKFINYAIKLDMEDIQTNFNLQIIQGERVVVLGNNFSNKKLVFQNLIKMFQKKHVKGDFLINQIQIYAKNISKQSLAKLFFYLERDIEFHEGTVRDSLPPILEQNHIQIIQSLWKELQIDPLFTLDTQLISLSRTSMQLFSLVKAIIMKPQVLIIDGGFTYLDSNSRRAVTKWFISSNINIIIDLTNRRQVIDLYPRVIQFAQF